jgi:polyphosphate:AMP phosphotransferase
MFEAAELGRKVPKKEFDKVAPTLRMELLQLQQRLRLADFPVIIVFAGVDGAGKHETVNLLNEWMDPRWIITHAYGKPSEEESERPEFWRFWRDLPPKGKIGIFLSSWYSRPVLERVHGEIGQATFDEALDRIVAFEKELADDGALILKFWMHMSKKAQAKRFKELEKDQLQSWRVTAKDWKNWRKFDRFVAAGERAIMRTSTGQSPWTIVEGVDPQYRYLTVAEVVRDGIRRHLDAAEVRRTAALSPAKKDSKKKKPDKEKSAFAKAPTILESLDMTQSLTREAYDTELKKQQGRVNKLFRKAKGKGISVVLVFEGWDAAGKGGAVRRLTAALDAHDYQIIPIAAPTDEEKAQHYLWRFWRQLSRAGRVTIFDRSWYGRVLVERVEGFAKEDEWKRAYAEINQFEEQLVQHGIVLVKYWLHITNEEQYRRFKERETTSYKTWKLTEEDWRNREKWNAYEQAVNDIAERTSTRIAPWTLVEANDKLFARVKVLRSLADRLEAALS